MRIPFFILTTFICGYKKFMSLKIEIIGLPASGKTFFYNNLSKKLNLQKKNYVRVINLKNFFIKKYLKTKTGASLLKKYAYKIYIKNVQIKSKFLFKKEYEDLNLFIKDNLKKNKNYRKILFLYKKYVNSSNYSSERKSRMLKNFEIDFLGFKFLNNNSNSPCRLKIRDLLRLGYNQLIWKR